MERRWLTDSAPQPPRRWITGLAGLGMVAVMLLTGLLIFAVKRTSPARAAEYRTVSVVTPTSTTVTSPVTSPAASVHQVVAVEPIFLNIPANRCAVSGTGNDTHLEGLTEPVCSASSPVIVVGPIFPICRVIGETLRRGDNENVSAWIVWKNQTGQHYVSPNLYLNVSPMPPCSPADNAFGVPDFDH